LSNDTESQFQRQKVITVIGSTYIEFIVMDLMAKAFDAYKKLDFSSRHFQTSIWEHGHATAAIVLSVIGIEAYRNRIYYIEKDNVSRGNNAVSIDLSNVLSRKNQAFPADRFKELLTEVFVVRDVIAHNHIYEVEVLSDQNWRMIGHKQRLLKGYGFDAKYKTSVNSRTKKTNLLKLNVQPAKIGFEDLFKVMAVFDLLVGVTQNILGVGHVPFRVHYEIDNYWVRHLSEILTHYFDQIPNQRFIKELEKLSKQLRRDFAVFLPTKYKWDWFITNTCPICSSLGFSKRTDLDFCNKCGCKVETVVEIPRP